MFGYYPTEKISFYKNPIISFYYENCEYVGDDFYFTPRKTIGDRGAMIGVKHNVLPLVRYLGLDLVFLITEYTRLHVCKSRLTFGDFLRTRLVFLREVKILQVWKTLRMRHLVSELQKLIAPPVIWSLSLINRHQRPTYVYNVTVVFEDSE